VSVPIGSLHELTRRSRFIQMLIMVLYSITLADFVRRWLQDTPASRVIGIKRWKTKALAAHAGPVDSREERKAKFLVGAIVFSTLVVFVRCVTFSLTSVSRFS